MDWSQGKGSSCASYCNFCHLGQDLDLGLEQLLESNLEPVWGLVIGQETRQEMGQDPLIEWRMMSSFEMQLF